LQDCMKGDFPVRGSANVPYSCLFQFKRLDLCLQSQTKSENKH